MTWHPGPRRSRLADGVGMVADVKCACPNGARWPQRTALLLFAALVLACCRGGSGCAHSDREEMTRAMSEARPFVVGIRSWKGSAGALTAAALDLLTTSPALEF